MFLLLKINATLLKQTHLFTTYPCPSSNVHSQIYPSYNVTLVTISLHSTIETT